VFAEVQAAFWKEEPGFRQALHTVRSREIYLVPNFISEGYFTQEVIPREFELAGPVTERDGRILYYCEPVGNHERMTEVLLHRAVQTAPGVPPEQTALVIVGHGTTLNDRSAEAARRQVERIRVLGRYAEVHAAYMEEPPLITDWAAFTAQPHVVVIPFFVADGLHSFQDIPVMLGIESEPGEALSQRKTLWRNPHHLQGRQLYYGSAIGTDPLFAEVILDQVEAFDEAHPERARGLAPMPSGALLQVRHIGQIAVSRRAEGFLLRHRDDEREEGLESWEGASAARALALVDDAGQYRPLKSAPNLRHGWRLAVRDEAELHTALEIFYPAALGVAELQASGTLVPVPLKATLGRQTGMYAVTRQATPEVGTAAVRACCVGGCLKQRLWEWEPGMPMPENQTPDGDAAEEAAVPLLCPEACHLLVAAVRRVIKRGGAA
jgi:sirohydrochlorin cobaltochelatase